MTERRHPNVINIEEVEPRVMTQGKRFGFSSRQLGYPTGAAKIGCSYYELEPGRTAWPFHYHCANEESLFVIEGEGTMRIGTQKVPVRAGDYISFPIGPEHAHQLENTGKAKIRYLCMSTMSTAEVVGYPDSKKFGMGAAPSFEAAMKGQGWVRSLHHEGTGVGYYDGEDVG